MASIIDAFQESLQEHNSFTKFTILAIPVYFCVKPVVDGETPIWWLYILTCILLLGYMIKCIYNVRNCKDHVLPSLNIFDLLWSGLKGAIAIGPASIICGIASGYLCNLASDFIPESALLKVLEFIISSLFSAIVLTCFLGYAKTFKIKDAYNFKAIFKSSADVMIAMLFMILQVAIVAILILLPVGYVLWLFFTPTNGVTIFFYCLLYVFLLTMTSHYLAQIDFENIAEEE